MPNTIIHKAATRIIAAALVMISVLPTGNADTLNHTGDTYAEQPCVTPATEGYSYDIRIINLTNQSLSKDVDINDVKLPKHNMADADAPAEAVIMYFTDDDTIALTKTLYDECRGVTSVTEQACVAWTVCNRVDDGYWGDTILEILEYPNAFAYNPNTEIDPELYELAKDVLNRWNAERNGETDTGRVLPPDYMYFHGDGQHNYFRNAYAGDYEIWDYSWKTPYKS